MPPRRERLLRAVALALICSLTAAASAATPVCVELSDDPAFAALRLRLASAYQPERAAALADLGERARKQPEQRVAWLGDADPALRRATARLLATEPDPALDDTLRAAFLREKEPAVVEALIAALARQPAVVARLGPEVTAAHDRGLSADYARLVRAVVLDAVAAKVRNGGVPGFYDGQFSDLWPISPTTPDDLLSIAYDDSFHYVLRVLAVMALAETRKSTLERDLAGLVKQESEELGALQRDFLGFRPSWIDVLQRREFAISRYVRFSLAKAGQTAAILRMIRRIDDFLEDPRQQQEIKFRGDRDEFNAWITADFLRDLFFDVGYYYQQFDDYASAEKRYRDLIDRFPGTRQCQNAHYNLACICAIQGRKREALDHLREAIRCGFTDHRWLREDGDLTSLRGDPEFDALVELARTGASEDAGRDWIRKLQRFLPAGTRSFFDLAPDQQREVLERGASELSAAQKQRLVDDAPAGQRERLNALLAGGR